MKECATTRGHSLASLHRRSVDVLRTELTRVGLPCAGPVLERVLYPHSLTHPIGIGKFLSFLPSHLSLRPRRASPHLVLWNSRVNLRALTTTWTDLHESETVDRNAP